MSTWAVILIVAVVILVVIVIAQQENLTVATNTLNQQDEAIKNYLQQQGHAELQVAARTTSGLQRLLERAFGHVAHELVGRVYHWLRGYLGLE